MFQNFKPPDRSMSAHMISSPCQIIPDESSVRGSMNSSDQNSVTHDLMETDSLTAKKSSDRESREKSFSCIEVRVGGSNLERLYTRRLPIKVDFLCQRFELQKKPSVDKIPNNGAIYSITIAENKWRFNITYNL